VCGRFTVRSKLNRILQEFSAELRPEYEPAPRYNVAPTQQIMTISLVEGRRMAMPRRWGLVPFWADDLKIGNSLINARAETVADKPAFRSSFKRDRCLVVADGFYEWKKLDAKTKQPYFIRMRDDRLFAFAGLAARWDKQGVVESATIITTEANALMAPLHDRMPVILPAEAFDLWLDPEFQSKEQLQALLRPYPNDDLIATPVSTLVNSPKNDDPCCVNPL
jgi:putative SOS response-associated peptidase YedK